jgi:hypothetical protein
VPTKDLAAIKVSVEQILGHPTWDLISLFALIAIGFFYGISAGKRMIVSTIIYTYVAIALLPVFPIERLAILSQSNVAFLKIIVFVAIFLALAIFLSRGGAQSFAVGNPWWQVFLLSFIQAGLLIHTALGFLPKEQMSMLAPLTRNIFANPSLKIVWLIGPLVLLVIIRWFDYRAEKKW